MKTFTMIKALPELVENIITSDSMTTIGKLFADDGACDSNNIFRYLSNNGILPCMKVRKNAKNKLKDDNFIRNCQSYLRKRICKGGRRIAL